MFREYSSNNNDSETKEFLIDFYKERYLYFLKNAGDYTNIFNTKITNTLIQATAKRLDQLIKGEINDKNRCHGVSKTYIKPRKYNSNRSFGWNNTSWFRYSDLDLKQINSINYPTVITETYIDKYTTAYRTLEGYK